MKTLLEKLKPQYREFLDSQENSKDKQIVIEHLNSQEFMMDLKYSQVLYIELFFKCTNIWEIF